MMSHLLPYNGDRRHLQPALCGELIDVTTQHAIGPPECPVCQQIDDDEVSLMSMRLVPPDPFKRPPVPLPEHRFYSGRRPYRPRRA